MGLHSRKGLLQHIGTHGLTTNNVLQKPEGFTRNSRSAAVSGSIIVLGFQQRVELLDHEITVLSCGAIASQITKIFSRVCKTGARIVSVRVVKDLSAVDLGVAVGTPLSQLLGCSFLLTLGKKRILLVFRPSASAGLLLQARCGAAILRSIRSGGCARYRRRGVWSIDRRGEIRGFQIALRFKFLSITSKLFQAQIEQTIEFFKIESSGEGIANGLALLDLILEEIEKNSLNVGNKLIDVL